jgi:hypothetical protein
MRLTTTVVEHDPTGSVVVVPAGELVPDWLEPIIRAGNPGIIDDKDPVRKTIKKSQKTQTVTTNAKDPVNPYAEKTLAELEEVAIAMDIDPDDFDDRASLENALIKAGAPTTITPSPKNPIGTPSVADIDLD